MQITKKQPFSFRATSRSVLLGAVACTTLFTMPSANAADLAQLPAYQVHTKVTGPVRVFGGPLLGFVEKWQQAFAKYHPDVQFANDFTAHSEGAYPGLYAVRADLAPSGDEPSFSDYIVFNDLYGYQPTSVLVASGGFEGTKVLWPGVFVVSKDNPLSKLTLDQVDRIFGAARAGGWTANHFEPKFARGPESNIRTWDQLGLTGQWSKKPIETSGWAYNGYLVYFQEKVFHGANKWTENYRECVNYHPEEGDDPEVQKISMDANLEQLAKDKYAIGWSSIEKVKKHEGLKVLSIAAKEGGPYVYPSAQTVADRSYPMTRDVVIYINRAPGQPVDPRVKEFLRFVLSREGQQILAKENLYFPLTQAAVAEQLKKLD